MKKLFTPILFLSLWLAACSTAAPPPETAPGPTQPAQIANPASQNCIDQGGTLQIEERGDGGQIGVCYFEDNRQCEEWALMNGACPAGGIKVTGYVTPAARYCAITGGTYAITGESNTENEQGTCTIPDGGVCDAWDYYNGVCTSESADSSAVSTVGWQWFVSAEAGYALQVPPDWTGQPLPDSNSGNLHGVAYTGPEGGVEVYWGAGFGGGCPSGTEPLMLAQGEVQACHTTNSDGTEQWNQIDYRVESGNDFSSRAYTSVPGVSSQSVLLQVLSTLTFRVPAKASIQPLSMEVCDGQAQAMSHTLDDLIPTQSEALLDDPVQEAWGVGCIASIAGTGEQFPSPSAVAEQLAGMLLEQGWVLDPQLAADGPTGTCSSYRKDDQIAQACATWQPDASVSCPADQPISDCQVNPAQQIYTVTLNSGVETALPASPSSGGSLQLVFDSNRAASGYRDLFILQLSDSTVQQLTKGDSNSFAGPWSPDGTRIVYTTFGLTNSQIAIINADGSGQAVIDALDGSDEAFPAWSPDGARIALTSRRDGNNEIYLMNPDGSNPIRLTDNPTDDFAPSWSPDGARLVFVSDRDHATGVYDLYIMNADGSGITQLTNDAALDYSPDWSPDGKTIVYRSHQGGPADIITINVDGTGLTNLTNNPAEDWAPVWSPDGSLIAFQSDRDGNWEIYSMAASGAGAVNLTKNPADDQLPYYQR